MTRSLNVQIILQTLTGEINITIPGNKSITWGEIKVLIAEKYDKYPVKSQLLFFQSVEMKDDACLEDLNLLDQNSLYLIKNIPAIRDNDYNLFITIHEFNEHDKLKRLEEVIQLTGDEKPSELNLIFDKMYQALQERIDKNATDASINPPTTPLLVLVGIPKSNTIKITPQAKGISSLKQSTILTF